MLVFGLICLMLFCLGCCIGILKFLQAHNQSFFAYVYHVTCAAVFFLVALVILLTLLKGIRI